MIKRREFNYYKRNAHYGDSKKNNKKFKIKWKDFFLIMETLLLIFVIIKYVPINDYINLREGEKIGLPLEASNILNQMTKQDYSFLKAEKESTLIDNKNKEIKKQAYEENDIYSLTQIKIHNKKRIKELTESNINASFEEYINNRIEQYILENKSIDAFIDGNTNKSKKLIEAENKIIANLQDIYEQALIDLNVPYERNEDEILYIPPNNIK